MPNAREKQIKTRIGSNGIENEAVVMLRKQMSVVVGVVLFVNMLASAGLVLQLDAMGQNLSGPQNVGASWTPIDTDGNTAPVTISARSNIDRDFPFDLSASGSTGTIYFAPGGTGVQDASGGGSKEISGKGGNQNEELIFSFLNSVSALSITIGFNKYEPGDGLDDDDDTVIFVVLSTGVDFTFDEVAFDAAFTSTGGKQGTIDFAQLGFGLNDLVSQVIVRETHKSMFVNQLGFTVIPAPGSLILLGLTGLMSSRRRRVA